MHETFNTLNQHAQLFIELKASLTNRIEALTMQEKEKFPTQPQPNPKG